MKEDFELSPDFNEEYIANVSLSYEYYEKSLKEVQDNSNTTNAQLGLLIGFNLTFIRFFLSNLPGKFLLIDCLTCNSCLILKLLAYLFSGISIFCCFRGLYARSKYFIIAPDTLLSECKLRSSTALKLGIIKIWQKKLKQFIELSKQKRSLFNLGILQLAIAITFAIANQGIAFFLG